MQTPGDRDLIRNRQQRLLEEQQRRLEELQQLPGKPLVTPEGPAQPDERCFDIREITLQGADLMAKKGTPISRSQVTACGKRTGRLAG